MSYSLCVCFVSQDSAPNPADRLSATATVRITITDADDLPPRFTYTGCQPVVDGVCLNPQYTAGVTIGQTGNINVQPETIKAVDGDSLNYPVRYVIDLLEPLFQLYIMLCLISRRSNLNDRYIMNIIVI